MEGYVVVEAALILPLASIVIVLLIWLGSYLYQGCFLSQAAYAAAFRLDEQPARRLQAFSRRSLPYLRLRDRTPWQDLYDCST